MKILAIEKALKDVEWDKLENLLKEEAYSVYDLYRSGLLREIYFTEDKNAVLILEAEDKKTAIAILDTLPLVKHGKIKFDFFELHPYTGYERIMK